MKRPHPVLMTVLVLVLGVGIFPGHATASTGDVYADEIIGGVRASTPSDAPGAAETPLEIAPDNGDYIGTSSDLTFEIPSAPGEALTLESPGDQPFTVGLPDVEVTEGVLNTDSDAVVFPESGEDVAVAIQAFDEGAQLSTVLNSIASPESFRYTVAVPAGGALTLLEGGGGIAITDGSGDAVGFMSKPWARDEMGATVPTRYTLSGNTVTQFVDHRSATFNYPIVADPFLGKDLIASAYWDWIERSSGGAIGAGWTLRVKPTKWARLNAGGYFIGWLGWRELYRKYDNRGLCCNLDSMKDQWICHQQFVALRQPFNATWNLDEWRKDVSYAWTVRHQCNPPRGGNYVYP